MDLQVDRHSRISRVSKKHPRYEIINKYNVTIQSLRQSIKLANTADELASLANKIADFERKIFLEKTAGYKQLEQERKQIQDQIDKKTRELKMLENEKNLLSNKIAIKIKGQKLELEEKIATLRKDYDLIVESLEDISETINEELEF